jgi:hypothetical protein
MACIQGIQLVTLCSENDFQKYTIGRFSCVKVRLLCLEPSLEEYGQLRFVKVRVVPL